MATGPGDGLEAADRGHLRASHADREQVVGTLKAAFVQGRLTKDELDTRAGQAFAARTYAELAAVTADLPAGLADPRPPAPARRSVNKEKKAVVALSLGTLAMAGITAAGPLIPDSPPFEIPIGLVFCLLFLAVPTGWLVLLHAWLEQRAGRQSAQGLPPGPSGQASRRLPPASPGRQFPPAGPGAKLAEAARSRRARPAPGWRPLRRWRTLELLPGRRPVVTGAP